MGHTVNPTSGAITIDNSPSTTADMNRLSDRIEEVSAGSVPTVAALNTVQHPRKGEVRRVDADDTYWGYNGGGWENIYRPDKAGTITLGTGVTAGVATIKQTGNVIELTIIDAQRTAAWTSGAVVATIATAAMRPTINGTPVTAFSAGTGLSHPAVVNANGQVLLFGNTGSGSGARTSFHVTWLA